MLNNYLNPLYYCASLTQKVIFDFHTIIRLAPVYPPDPEEPLRMIAFFADSSNQSAKFTVAGDFAVAVTHINEIEIPIAKLQYKASIHFFPLKRTQRRQTAVCK